MTASEPRDDSNARSGGTSGSRTRGRSPLRKLSDDQEQELTQLYRDTETSVPEIARRFGVGESSVYRIAQKHGADLRSASGRGRSSTAATTSATAASSDGAGERTTGRRRGRAAAAGAARAPRAPRAQRGRRATSAAAAPAQRRTRTRRAATTASSSAAAGTGGSRRFRVSFRGEATVDASSIRDAIAKAEALGATDITGVELMS
jgi:transposase-like protein